MLNCIFSYIILDILFTEGNIYLPIYVEIMIALYFGMLS